jgi:CxxC motif-containing protein (DUF1111 family)
VKRVSIFLSLFVLTGGAPYESNASKGEAFTQPIAGLDDAYIRNFRAGSALFRQAWVIGASQDHPDAQGLGPLYNRLSCIACHVKNGRGSAPDSENGVIRTMVVRLGVAGKDAHGGPLPHPIYGAQLNPEGVPGVPGEGRAILAYEESNSVLLNGSTVPMRRPILSFRDLAYGPLDAQTTKTSLRIAPPVFGLGLLEAVPEQEILTNAGPNGTGRGRPNYVWDIETGKRKLGRFGLKANQPSLKQQVANAFAEDIGITSELFPHESCSAAQTACNAAAREERPELRPSQLASMLDYMRGLAAPARRDVDDARVIGGEALFHSLGCALCHRETLTLGSFAPVPALSGAAIHPYSDLLLHDMGEELADGRDDFEAGPRDWRTPPLWGLGLVGNRAVYLHDGRARTPAEAILWHGGEAQSAAEAFRSLPRNERDALLAFLNSL